KKYKFEIPPDKKKFWMPEYWDRYIRNAEHFQNTIQYILDNPLNANLPEDAIAHQFKGSVLTDEEIQGLHPSQIKMIMTRGQDDPKELYDMLGTKEYRKSLDTQFKDEKS